MKTRELRMAIIKEMKGSVIFNGFTTRLESGSIRLVAYDSTLFNCKIVDELDIHFYAGDTITVYTEGHGKDLTSVKECFSFIVENIKVYCSREICTLHKLYNGVLANEELDGY